MEWLTPNSISALSLSNTDHDILFADGLTNVVKRQAASNLESELGLTFVISGIHGRYDLLRKAAEEINTRSEVIPGHVVFLGDYIDHGPESRSVVEFLMRADQDGAVTCLRVAHEALLIDAFRTRTDLAVQAWLRNGGAATLLSYGQRAGETPDLDHVPLEHVEWMESLPLTAKDGLRVYGGSGATPSLIAEETGDRAWSWEYEHRLRSPSSRSGPVSGHYEIDAHAMRPDAGSEVLQIGVFDDRKREVADLLTILPG